MWDQWKQEKLYLENVTVHEENKIVQLEKQLDNKNCKEKCK